MLSCEIWKFLRTPISKNICGQLLLNFTNKETPTPMFSCEFCKFFKNIYFVEHLLTAGFETPVPRSPFNKTASLNSRRPVTLLVRDSSTGIFLWILGKLHLPNGYYKQKLRSWKNKQKWKVTLQQSCLNLMNSFWEAWKTNKYILQFIK